MNSPNIIEKELSYEIVGILFEVHNTLGGEYQEKYYQRAVARALKERDISFKEQIPVDLKFGDEKIGKYILDFLIAGKIVLEIKAVPRLKPIYFRQVRAYLKANHLELGILANFHGDRLTYKRILCPIRTKNSDNSNSDTFVSLARRAVENYLKTGKILEPPPNLPKTMLTRRAGVFVSLHKKKPSPLPTQEPKKEKPLPHLSIFDGLETEELRGCIGTFLPTTENIATEIIKNAVHSASADPRFPPVTEDELSDLIYSVDILSQPKKLAAKRYTLNPKKYGLIVSTPDGRRGLLLPNIPGIETAEEQFKICCLKAGIFPEEKVKLEIFTVERHAEK